MSLYVIGDLHLSFSTDKPMDVFSPVWHNHPEKLKASFSSRLTADDTVVLCGDLSWGMNLQECREDFAFIHSLPGKKILLKGNHDYWWDTVTKMQRFFDEKGFSTIRLLHNNHHAFGDIGICGTRIVPTESPRRARVIVK